MKRIKRKKMTKIMVYFALIIFMMGLLTTLLYR